MCVTVSELNMVILYFYFLFSLSVIYCYLLYLVNKFSSLVRYYMCWCPMATICTVKALDFYWVWELLQHIL